MPCCKKCGEIFQRTRKGSFEKYCLKCLKEIEDKRSHYMKAKYGKKKD